MYWTLWKISYRLTGIFFFFYFKEPSTKFKIPEKLTLLQKRFNFTYSNKDHFYFFFLFLCTQTIHSYHNNLFIFFCKEPCNIIKCTLLAVISLLSPTILIVKHHTIIVNLLHINSLDSNRKLASFVIGIKTNLI